MSIPVILHSSQTLETWDWTNPWTKGIGGSETQHIEMTERLKRRGFNVISYAPILKQAKGPADVVWRPVNRTLPTGKAIIIWHRNPLELDRPKPKGQKWWFLAQDVDYPGAWNEERLEKIDRYICLCRDHVAYTLARYPSLKSKIYQSSNGIRTDYLRKFLHGNTLQRRRNTLFFPSSPDRGLKFLLQQWFRIREINRKAELTVAYGFDNMQTIVNSSPNDWRANYMKELEALSHQEGVYFVGRRPQNEIYNAWLQTSIWAHPTDFPETSCITCMEAQALGAYPVTNDLWALRDNVQFGWMTSGEPQKNELSRTMWLHALDQAFGASDKGRKEMSEWALENFDWERIVSQWENWIKEDTKVICDKV